MFQQEFPVLSLAEREPDPAVDRGDVAQELRDGAVRDGRGAGRAQVALLPGAEGGHTRCVRGYKKPAHTGYRRGRAPSEFRCRIKLWTQTLWRRYNIDGLTSNLG